MAASNPARLTSCYNSLETFSRLLFPYKHDTKVIDLLESEKAFFYMTTDKKPKPQLNQSIKLYLRRTFLT